MAPSLEGSEKAIFEARAALDGGDGNRAVAAVAPLLDADRIPIEAAKIFALAKASLGVPQEAVPVLERVVSSGAADGEVYLLLSRQASDPRRMITACLDGVGNAQGHLGLHERLLDMVRGMVAPQSWPDLLNVWLGKIAPGRGHAEAIDRLADLLGEDAGREKLFHTAAATFLGIGWTEESLRIFHHACVPYDGRAFNARLVQDRFDTSSQGYDGVAWAQEAARQFFRFAEDHVSLSRRFSVLDAGCGTGLVGAMLAPRVDRLVGVDLSGEMLQKARKKGVYADLIEGEIADVMGRAEHREAYDLIICNWCLIYMADLQGVFRAAAAALKPGGRLAFSTYACLDGVRVKRWEPNPEYAHGRDYLRGAIEDCGLSRKVEEIRHLSIHPGFFVVAEKAAGDPVDPHRS